MMKCLLLNQVPEGILEPRKSILGLSKDVFPSTETSLPATAGNEGAAELAPSAKKKRPM